MSSAGHSQGRDFARSEFAAIMEAAVDAIVVIDDGGSILSFSRAAETMFGYSVSEVIGHPVTELMPDPYRSQHQDYIDRYQQTGRPHIMGVGRQVEAIRKDGEVFPVWLSVGETRTESGSRFVGIIRDLSEQRRAELERHSLEQSLAHVSRLSLLGEMAAGIAHEINQPLTAIANYSKAARNMLDRGNNADERLRQACHGIADQVQRAGEVITNLRKFVRRREIEKSQLDIGALVSNLMVLIRADARHEGVEVNTRLAHGLPQVMGNVVQLQQVLLNLTRNAVDAMQANGNRPKEILIETVATGSNTVEIRVFDTGPGVPQDLVDAIFHPFFTTKEHGLGVGLAISHSIVEAHGGSLRVESRTGGGSGFIIELPTVRNDGLEADN